MASELSNFISDELDKRGYSGPGNDHQFLVSEPQSSTAPTRIENKSRLNVSDNQSNRWKTYICVGFSVLVILVVWIVLLATASGSKNDNSIDKEELKSSTELEIPQHTRNVPEVQQIIEDDVVPAPFIEPNLEQETQETSDEGNKTSGISEGEKSTSSQSVFAYIPLNEISPSTAVAAPQVESVDSIEGEEASSPSPKVAVISSFPPRSPRIATTSVSDPRGGRKLLLQNY
eukprot:TRINITY_DN2058_c2_g1_i1.p2 TRINITY_DN2058_c2_g1~~TRINITY_DN2058_c2_g1_i1.p2  ORF type:complete len:244 (-),score=39.75 TRINITY_DN2058_c2_g1_i1:1008-1700(-)